MSNQEKLRERLELLKAEHRDLDDAILALAQRAEPDMLQLARLKKKKLLLKDDITRLESELLPDIIA
ncbi:MAG: YdcH family protein [Bdellovibrionales bacterium]